MAHGQDITEIQRKAEAFLLTVFQACRSSTQDSARAIAQLAYSENPVSSLFRDANLPRLGATPPTADSLRGPTADGPSVAIAQRPSTSNGGSNAITRRTSTKFLRLFRSREKLRPDRIEVSEGQRDADPTYSNVQEQAGPAPDPDRFKYASDVAVPAGGTRASHGGRSVKPSSKATAGEIYYCLFCDKNYGSKGARGVFKRHLKDRHVAPFRKGFSCHCGAVYREEAEAKLHRCDWTAILNCDWREERQIRRVYACDHTGEFFGSSMDRYLEHLLELGKLDRNARPPGSRHVRLRAILGQPGLRDQVEQLSLKHFGSRETWRSLRWCEDVLPKTIEDFEAGVIDFAPKIGDDEGLRLIRDYLDHLFSVGHLPGLTKEQSVPIASSALCYVSDTTPTLEAVNSARAEINSYDAAVHQDVHGWPFELQAERVEMVAEPPPPAYVDCTTANVKGKRPRSLQSAAVTSHRRPGAPMNSHERSSNGNDFDIAVEDSQVSGASNFGALPLRLSAEERQYHQAATQISQQSTLPSYTQSDVPGYLSDYPYTRHQALGVSNSQTNIEGSHTPHAPEMQQCGSLDFPTIPSRSALNNNSRSIAMAVAGYVPSDTSGLQYVIGDSEDAFQAEPGQMFDPERQLDWTGSYGVPATHDTFFWG